MKMVLNLRVTSKRRAKMNKLTQTSKENTPYLSMSACQFLFPISDNDLKTGPLTLSCQELYFPDVELGIH